MEIQQIRYFVAVAAVGSFTQAAKRCHVTQPALSNAILQLEEECGYKLLERLHHKVALTASGEAFLIRGRNIVSEVDHIPRELRDLHASHRGRLAFGVPPTVAPFLLPKVVGSFVQECPDVQLTITTEKTTAELTPLLKLGAMELAIVTLPVHDGSLAVEKLFTEELLLALPARHLLRRKHCVEGPDLRDQSFILMKDGHCLAEQTRVFFHEHAIRPHVVLETHQIEILQGLIATGLGVSLVPAMARLREYPDVVYRSLENPKPTRTIAVAWRKGHEPTCVATEFLSQLRKVAKEFSSQPSAEPQ
jgi:LysR family hydrogen peroxide-inducible transcriptional activator